MYNLIVILGPTASGKTSFAANLAFKLNGEIISADSRQVYRNMNIGTGKDYADYYVNGTDIPVHLIDIVDPGYKYSVFEYQRDFLNAYSDISKRSKIPVMCGGSGMYIDACTRRYRMDTVPVNENLRNELKNKSLSELSVILSDLKILHNKTDIDTIEHALRAIEIETFHKDNPDIKNNFPALNPLFIGIMYDRDNERKRITERLKQRLNNGMIKEVETLLKSGIPADSLLYYGLEYKFITLYLSDEMRYEEMENKLNIAIHQFAKRQRTWFRKMEKEGCKINWIEGELPLNKKLEIAVKLFSEIK